MLRPSFRLAKKPVAEKKLAITVFSFPPDKGNVGTAAYLNVFGSIYRVLKNLQAEGYDVGEIPEDATALIQTVSFKIPDPFLSLKICKAQIPDSPSLVKTFKTSNLIFRDFPPSGLACS